MEELIARVTQKTGLDAATAERRSASSSPSCRRRARPPRSTSSSRPCPAPRTRSRRPGAAAGGGGLMGMMGSMGGGVMALGGQLMGAGVSMGQMQPLGQELFAYGREKAGEDVMGPIVGLDPGPVAVRLSATEPNPSGSGGTSPVRVIARLRYVPETPVRSTHHRHPPPLVRGHLLDTTTTKAPDADLSLAADFPAATREQWLELVEGVLKGADFERKLVGRTHDGIEIQPLYPKAEAPCRSPRGRGGPWRVSQRIDHPDPAHANELALLDLEGGADALTLVTRKAPAPRAASGSRSKSLDDLDRALSGVMLDLIHLRLDAGRARPADRGAARRARRAARPRALRALGRFRPRSDRRHGGARARCRRPGSDVARRMRRHPRRPDRTRFRGPGRSWPMAGPITRPARSEAQELAAVLATGVAYLRAAREPPGISLDAARGALAFLLVADADEFLTIAKFRALRRLWARVEEACGLEPQPIRLHAETAWRMTTRRDPWVNMLRTTVAAFSAGIGGADAVTVLPFTAALGLARRLRAARRPQHAAHPARRGQSLARRRSRPPAPGGFEALTERSARRPGACSRRSSARAASWRACREARSRSGSPRSDPFASARWRPAGSRSPARASSPHSARPTSRSSLRLPSGTVRWKTPRRRRRGRPSTIPSEAAGGGSPPASRTAFADLVRSAAEGSPWRQRPEPGWLSTTPLPSWRLAEPFERLRDRSDALLAATGSRPRVFLANLGPLSRLSPPAPPSPSTCSRPAASRP